MVSKMVKEIFVLRRNPVVVALTAIITGVYLREALSSIYRLTSVRTTQPLTLPPGHEPAETNWTVYKSTYTFSVNVVP
jgi:hypothetical protein